MSKKIAPQTQVVPVVEAKPAEILPFDTIDQSHIALPAGFESGEEISSLVPMVNFEVPGEYCAGVYVGVKENVGKFGRQIHHLKLTVTGETIGVWGSTILDDKMKMAGLQVGEKVLIQYLGDVATSKGLNPAKNFRVIVSRDRHNPFK